MRCAKSAEQPSFLEGLETYAMPGRTKETPKQAEIARQCLEVEEFLVRGVSMRRIVKRCAESWECSPATVYNRVQQVRDAWRAEATKYDRSELRDAHRERLLKIYNMAVNRKRPLRDAEGNPVMNRKGGRAGAPLPPGCG